MARAPRTIHPIFVLNRNPGGSPIHRWSKPLVAALGGPPTGRRGRGLFTRVRAAIKCRTLWLARRVEPSTVCEPAPIPRARVGDTDLRQRIFQTVYEQREWGGEPGSAFFSGEGSRGRPAQVYAAQMAKVLQGHTAELGHPPTIIDLGCGDFEVGRALVERLPGATYIGCDIVPELVAHNDKRFANERVSFRKLDMVTDPLPDGDVCLVRQVLQHLSNAEILAVLQKLKHRYVYVTEGHPTQLVGPVNPDKSAGGDVRFDWRRGFGRGVQLDHPPFNRPTEEVFRVAASPRETIVTDRLAP